MRCETNGQALTLLERRRVESILLEVRDGTAEPGRHKLPRDDPRDSAVWDSYRNRLERAAREDLTEAGIEFLSVDCGRYDLGVDLGTAGRVSIEI